MAEKPRKPEANRPAGVPLPELPAWPEMVSGCKRLTAAVPEVVLARHTVGILQVRPYLMPRGWSVNVHEHSFYEASIVLRGSASARDAAGRNGQKLPAGHVYFHGPHAPHNWAATDEECLRLILWFTVDPAVPVIPPKRWPQWPEVLFDAAQLLQVVRRATPGWIDQAGARLAAILARVLTMGELPEDDATAFGAAAKFVPAVDAFLNDNLKHPISLADIAAAVGVSQSGLIHRYRKEAGVSVGQRLLALRMEEAARLLKHTDLPLKAICPQVGLSDPAYLCRLFKRYFRASPGEYRSSA